MADRLLERVGPRRPCVGSSVSARFKVERIFIEPYLAARLGVSSDVLGFQGCRAARHDDHIHIQIKR